MDLPPRLAKTSLHLRKRALWAGVFAIAAIARSAHAPPPPDRTAEGVAAMLGAAAGGEVHADDFVWEARGGFLSDGFLGRRVLFLARRPGPGGVPIGDLFRARVRLSRAGRPMSLDLVRNLTRSPAGDDRELVALGHHAAFVTSAFGGVQGITLLDLDGEGDAREARTWTERLAASIESWLATGSTRGVGRTEVTFGAPPVEVREEIQGDLLVMALGKEAQAAAIGVRDGALDTGAENPFAAVAQRIPHRARPLSDVVVDATRELVGAGAAEVLRSVMSRARPPRAAPSPTPPRAGPAIPEAAGDWPPPPIAPVIQPPLDGEGAWVAGRIKASVESPPCIYETFVRPDRRYPGAVVRFAAIDTRQIDLRLEAGVDEPRSPTGLHGAGRPPLDLQPERVVAVIASGPARVPGEADGDEPGFVVERRIFAPPLARAPTLAIAADGHAEIGTWSFGAVVPVAVASLRQAMDPLGDGARAVERSAMGLLPTGQIVYVWGAGVRPDTMELALGVAGCKGAVSLADGDAPAGLVYLRPSASPHGWDAEPMAEGMSFSFAQLATPGAKPLAQDALYAVLRNTGPRLPLPPPAAGTAPGAWAPDPGRQPAPAWLPAIHSAVIVSVGAQVHLTTVAPGRASFHLRLGAKEPATKAAVALPGQLTSAEEGRVLVAIGLGAGKRKGARGIFVGGAVGYPFRGDDAGALVIDHGRIRVVRATEVTPAAGVDATELPLVADDGKLLSVARDVGSMRPRAAACVLDDGTFAVASTTFDSDEAAATALLDLGCTRVVVLDRGSHHSAFVHRTGTETPPQAHYDPSALYVLDAPLSGRATPL